MNILVINCGSSSLKFQLIDAQSERLIAKGLCERIAIDGSRLIYSPAGGAKQIKEVLMQNHKEAIGLVLKALTDTETGVIESLKEIGAVGHRLVHGGEHFACATLIGEEVKQAIVNCTELAPLHNPANLTGIEACEALMPGIPMVGVFDTAFHQTMPEEAYLYGIPYHYYTDYKIRRYGFHGTSHAYVAGRAACLLGTTCEQLKIIVCHLGNGASVSAVKHGRCVDTSMGLTPLEGLIMGTRSGDLDPGIVEYISQKEGKDIHEIMNILNKESGVLGLSKGLSSDYRDLLAAMEAADENAARALKAYAHRVIHYIGAYAAVMDGVDAVVFTAGLGENDPWIREAVCSHLSYLGVWLDPQLNRCRGEERIVTTPDSRTKVLAIPTNEELAIARETYRLVRDMH